MTNDIRELIDSHPHDDHLLEKELATLVKRYGPDAYRELLSQLTGKVFTPQKSRAYWEQAQAHRDYLERSSGHRVGLRTALLNILHTHAGELSCPVFMESEHLESLRHASVTDGLTGLYDQTYFKHFLCRNLSQHRRADDCHSALILFDVDRFKQYNDRCGHLAGDEALRTIADILRHQIRDHDVIARYGGEEFALFLPRADRMIAHAVADRIRRVVEATPFPGEENLDSGNLTISGGIAIFPRDAEDAESLIVTADRHLYQAKARRNAIAPASTDRRRESRLRVQSIVEYCMSENDVFSCGLVYDISSRGVGFGGCRMPATDDPIILRFARPFWPSGRQMRGRVRQVRTNNVNEVIYLGVEFERQLDEIGIRMPDRDRPSQAGLPFHITNETVFHAAVPGRR